MDGRDCYGTGRSIHRDLAFIRSVRAGQERGKRRGREEKGIKEITKVTEVQIIFLILLILREGAREMAWWLKVFAALAENPSLIPTEYKSSSIQAGETVQPL